MPTSHRTRDGRRPGRTGDVRISFAGMSGVLPLAAVLLAAMAAGIAVTLILGTARLTQLRPLTRRRLR